ncbi:MAG: class I SAM-dependent methyltransferase, partial [Flavobacteriales bacterium]|nr:class I SAM-dependent methyltransferase [Flavobacteriales bacterium]
MESIVLSRKLKTRISKSKKNDVIEFFENASADYSTWSKKYNMHFGLANSFKDIFRLEQMLDNTNEKVFEALELPEGNSQIADLGSGLGAVARYMCAKLEGIHVICSNVVQEQLRISKLLDNQFKFKSNIKYLMEDYRSLSIPSNSLDGAYAIESECYADGSNKKDFVKEAYRVLKPEANLVIANCMIKVKEKSLSPLVKRSYRKLCDHWAFDEMSNIDELQKCLHEEGFRDIKIQDYSNKVAFSALWIPLKIV